MERRSGMLRNVRMWRAISGGRESSCAIIFDGEGGCDIRSMNQFGLHEVRCKVSQESGILNKDCLFRNVKADDVVTVGAVSHLR